MTCRVCGTLDSSCRDAFHRKGIHTVHWECWSDCNLQCDFCYRSLRRPLDTSSALRLIDAIAHAGATRIILAGGDPSLRSDLDQLCRHAVTQGLKCEIQTNAHKLTRALLESLPLIDRVYLSLDGATSAAHDMFRAKRGNFAGVNRLLGIAESGDLPVTVHSVASKRNWREMPDVLEHIRKYSCVDTWSVLEFSAVGTGYLSRREHELAPAEWQEVSIRLHAAISDRPRLALLGVHDKRALYAMVSADGYAYRAAESASSQVADHGRIGSIIDTHLQEIADAWRIDSARHQQRYAHEAN